MNLKNIINAVKVIIILFVVTLHSTVLFNHQVNKIIGQTA